MAICMNKQITPPSLPKSKTTERYDSLDGLRAYSMICIVIMHVKAFLPYSEASVIGTFSYFVALFMMVSAFSMCCGYYDKVKNGLIQPSRFYGRRYMRILPYFAFLCLLDLVLLPSIPALYEFFANATLCFGLLPNPQMNMMGLGWFVGLIFVFYILFPFFVFMLDNKKRAWVALVITYAFSLIAVAYFYRPPFVSASMSIHSIHNIIYFLPFFVAGGLIYLYRNDIFAFGQSHKITTGIITLFLSIAYFIVIDVTHDEYIRLIITLVMFSVWVIYAISTNSMFLNNKFTNFLSKISMEMYLAQMVVFRGIMMIHPERYIQNDTILYVAVSLATLVLLIPFTYITKYYIVDKVVDKIVKK